mmetsp:Transcript_39937/g.83535  ORF Transcript_39937/g.83535 Transcript_39937/m.83535 type:complete len:234 (-) Transcript_39937:71-772(-)
MIRWYWHGRVPVVPRRLRRIRHSFSRILYLCLLRRRRRFILWMLPELAAGAVVVLLRSSSSSRLIGRRNRIRAVFTRIIRSSSNSNSNNINSNILHPLPHRTNNHRHLHSRRLTHPNRHHRPSSNVVPNRPPRPTRKWTNSCAETTRTTTALPLLAPLIIPNSVPPPFPPRANPSSPKPKCSPLVERGGTSFESPTKHWSERRSGCITVATANCSLRRGTILAASAVVVLGDC